MANSSKVKIEESIIQHALSGMYDIVNNMDADDTFDIDELHNRLFNEDYFIIGYWEAKQWLKKNDLDAFDVIEVVQEYEENNFGKSNTSINSEAMVNMYAYIRGEELLSELDIDYSTSQLSKNEMTDLLLQIKSLMG